MRRLLLVLSFAFFEMPLAAQVEERKPDDTGVDVNSRAYALTEKGCIGARVLDYLERHGTYGKIDPEVLLVTTRDVVEKRQLDRLNGIPDGVGGSVWTSLGPNNGAGRATAAATHPTVAGTALVGAAGGGVWKTTDTGASWTPLTETVPNLSVGAVAYAPSSPNTIYLGSGEGGYAIDFIPGIGLLTSTDGGTNWTLPASVIASMFYRISVHPTIPNELVIATNAGAQRSTNGQNGPWTNVINSTPAVGVTGYGDVTDLVRDPTNPLVMYASTWDRQNWCQRFSCSTSFNFAAPTVLKSADGGQTWSPAATGLPVSTSTLLVNRISLAIAPSSTSTLYAATETFDVNTGINTSRVYKTINGGAAWTETGLSANVNTSISRYMNGQGWYDNTIVVSPTNPDVVIAGGVGYVRSSDGGTNWVVPPAFNSVHVDAHDLRFDAANTLWIANDGGIWTSNDNTGTAAPIAGNMINRNTNLVTRQYYAMSQDVVFRNRVIGGTQDNGTNRRTDAGGTSYTTFSGGDGFACLISPVTPGVVYSTYQFAALNRTTNLASNHLGDISPVYATSGDSTPFFSLLYADPNAPATIYTGTQRVWKSTTGGDAWLPLATTISGAGTWNGSTVRSIAVAKTNAQIIMAAKGSTVYRSTDGGAAWTIVTTGLPGRTVTHIEIDPADAQKAYVTLAGQSATPVYYTTNGGTNWTARSTGLPVFSALVLRVDPTDVATLYCGTDVGVYRSTDSGANWSAFGTGLPAVSVYDIRVMSDGSALRIATHGRGIWELNVTGVTNAVPAATINTPAATSTVTRGTLVPFAGTTSDPNGNPLTARWSFADDWSSTSVGAPGAANASHTFWRPGIWPVALTATDSAGGIGGSEVSVTVLEEGDDCANPIVIPASGPFPYSVTINPEAATKQAASDPLASCYPFTYNRSVWFSFTPATSSMYVFSLCGSRAAGWVSGYTGAACGAYTPISLCLLNTSPDFNCATDTSAGVVLTAGTTYRFLASHYFSNMHGPLTVTVNTVAPPAAMAGSVSPFTGPAAGGQVVTITGSGFVGGSTTVNVGGTAATSVNVITPNILTAITPAHGAGLVDLSVTTPSATATLRQPYVFVAASIAAPTGLVATATSTTSVALNWSAVVGAASYEVLRSTGGGYTTVGSPGVNSFTDSTAVANTAYLYKVRAVGAGAELSADSNIDLATTTIFTNDPLTAGTAVKAVHVTQLRTAVNAVRATAGLGAFSFTDASLAAVRPKAVHITELRTAINAARAALTLSALSYTNTLVAGTTPVRAVDFTEVRNGVK